MAVRYGQKNLTAKELAHLFRSVGWDRRGEEKKCARCIRGTSLIYTARDGKKLIAALLILTDGVFCSHISEMAVLPGYQGKGIGKTLVKRWISDMDKKGFAEHGELTLFASKTSGDFYARMNFSKAENGMYHHYARYDKKPKKRRSGQS